MPKQKTGKHAPLGAVIIADRTARPTMRTKMRIARKEEEETLEEVRTACVFSCCCGRQPLAQRSS
jgi:hypothetical protein